VKISLAISITLSLMLLILFEVLKAGLTEKIPNTFFSTSIALLKSSFLKKKNIRDESLLS
jgi:hypothetical protein